MARVTADLPRPSELVTVDSKEFLTAEEESALLDFDPDTGLPRLLRAFVVVRDPKMTVVPHFFSEPECDHLIGLVDGCWMPSMVGQATYNPDATSGKSELENTVSMTRTSWSCMMRYAQTEVVERLEHRLAALTGLPTEQLERMNMVRYAPGEQFNEHHDGKFRPITVFVYLNDLPEGEDRGDTFFPHLGVSFRPRRGTAVMWSNVESSSQQEDSRMLHSGRAPTKGVKYGVNCFFNIRSMRHLMQTCPDFPVEQAALVHVADLCKPNNGMEGSADGATNKIAGDARMVAYRLCPEPRIIAMPAFLSEVETEHLMGLLGDTAAAAFSDSFYRDGTQTLCLLEVEQTPLVKAIENRLATTAGLSLKYLARLRIVRPGTRVGLCNRGCGPKSAYVCLSDRDEVFFTRLCMRLVLQRGDLLMWPNVDWETGQPMEDVRTMRKHVAESSGGDQADLAAIGLDVFFHDNPVREQQRERQFVADSAIRIAPCESDGPT